mmetsp:Transcript_64533/g.154145  ORF Transcript_64533/g.154145 Transcript_64533/m.154145 type:complete len:276 (-) Transcript_64533:211-1038(-)
MRRSAAILGLHIERQAMFVQKPQHLDVACAVVGDGEAPRVLRGERVAAGPLLQEVQGDHAAAPRCDVHRQAAILCLGVHRHVCGLAEVVQNFDMTGTMVGSGVAADIRRSQVHVLRLFSAQRINPALCAVLVSVRVLQHIQDLSSPWPGQASWALSSTVRPAGSLLQQQELSSSWLGQQKFNKVTVTAGAGEMSRGALIGRPGLQQQPLSPILLLQKLLYKGSLPIGASQMGQGQVGPADAIAPDEVGPDGGLFAAAAAAPSLHPTPGSLAVPCF